MAQRIYIVDSGVAEEYIQSDITFTKSFSVCGDFYDRANHGTSMIRALHTTNPDADTYIIKCCDEQSIVTKEYCLQCLEWLDANLTDSDIVVWTYLTENQHIDYELEKTFLKLLNRATWIFPAGNHYSSTEQYFPCSVTTELKNCIVVGTLNKSKTIASSSNTPADVYVSGTNQPVLHDNGVATGSSISAAYYAGIITSNKENFYNDFNEEIFAISLG